MRHAIKKASSSQQQQSKQINETPWDNIQYWIICKQLVQTPKDQMSLFMGDRFETLNSWARIGVTRLDSYDDCDNTAVGLSAINSILPSSSLVSTISYRYLYYIKNFKIILVEKNYLKNKLQATAFKISNNIAAALFFWENLLRKVRKNPNPFGGPKLNFQKSLSYPIFETRNLTLLENAVVPWLKWLK